MELVAWSLTLVAYIYRGLELEAWRLSLAACCLSLAAWGLKLVAYFLRSLALEACSLELGAWSLALEARTRCTYLHISVEFIGTNDLVRFIT